MSVASLLRKRWTLIILAASSIQGITPDIDDLASPLGLYLLCPNDADHDFVPPDDSTGDMCTPVHAETTWIVRVLLEASHRSSLASPQLSALWAASSRLSLDSSNLAGEYQNTSKHQLLHFLCQANC